MVSKQMIYTLLPGRVAQSVTCLATDAGLTADPGVASSILALSHTFAEIDHEIISTVILLPSAESFKKGCCQLQAKVCARSTGLLLIQACPGKSVVRSTDRPAMTIAVDLGRKATKQTNNVHTTTLVGRHIDLLQSLKRFFFFFIKLVASLTLMALWLQSLKHFFFINVSFTCSLSNSDSLINVSFRILVASLTLLALWLQSLKTFFLINVSFHLVTLMAL